MHAVRGVDLLIAPGEVVAFLGPNGAGKSTTIDLLLGLTPPDSGSVRIFGSDPMAAVRAGRVGAMLQAGALLPDVTVRELVTMFAGLHRHPMPVAAAMQLAGITDIAGQRTQKLSGGQAQRVRFALALVPDPDLLVLDGATAAMDVEVRRAFWASMREFTATGRTVLFATHYLQEADQFADRQATRALLHCNDSDLALRELLDRFPQAHDIEVAAGNLEDAFLELVATSRQEAVK